MGAEGWHPGVVGIIAAQLVDKFARPAVVIAFEAGRGGARRAPSPAFNLYEALVGCAPHLSRFGGHAAAAGMSLTHRAWTAFAVPSWPRRRAEQAGAAAPRRCRSTPS